MEKMRQVINTDEQDCRRAVSFSTQSRRAREVVMSYAELSSAWLVNCSFQ